MLLLTVVSMVFFMCLGFWQLHRAEEKESILSAQANMKQQKPQLWHSGQLLPKLFQPLQVMGKFSSSVLLLDNQHHEHQFGYNVLSPLILEDKSIVLVDRGWVAGDPTRISLPKISVPREQISIIGTAYFPSSKSMVLGELIEKRSNKQTIIESLDIPALRQLLHNQLYPFIIRLDKNEANGFVRDWAVVSLPPQRHYAYALQWFSFALVVLILFISLNLKKKQ